MNPNNPDDVVRQEIEWAAMALESALKGFHDAARVLAEKRHQFALAVSKAHAAAHTRPEAT